MFVVCILDTPVNWTEAPSSLEYQRTHPMVRTGWHSQNWCIINNHFFLIQRSEWMNEWMFNDTPARKTDRLLGIQRSSQKCIHHINNVFYYIVKSNSMNEWMFNDTPAQKTDRLLGVRKRKSNSNLSCCIIQKYIPRPTLDSIHSAPYYTW